MPSSVIILSFIETRPVEMYVSASLLEQSPLFAIYLLSLIPSRLFAAASFPDFLTGLAVFFSLSHAEALLPLFSVLVPPCALFEPYFLPDDGLLDLVVFFISYGISPQIYANNK